MTAQLSAESYEGWKNYAAENDVTVTGLVEALGTMLAAGLPRRVETELLTIARATAAERKARRPT